MTNNTHAGAANLDDVIAYLWQVAGAFSQSEETRAIAPPQLEFQLNGGASPMVARYYSNILTERSPLPERARILDLGCGYGRIALELANRLTPDQQYFGLDPNREAVTWAQQNIATQYSNFTFSHIDITSLPYNPTGTVAGSGFRFPFDDGSLDVVFMISVMTHVDLKTVETYVREAARTLNPVSGRFVATFFLLDNEVDHLLASGASSFTMQWKHGQSRVENPNNPELAIAHPRDAVRRIVRDAGFESVSVSEGFWSGRTGTGDMDYQDLLIADRTPKAALKRPQSSDPISVWARDPLNNLAIQLANNKLTTPEVLAPFMTWAVAATLNTLWWQTAGLTLVTGDQQPIELGFDVAKSLEFHLRATQASHAGRYVALGDQQVLDLVVGAGPLATRRAVVNMIAEVAQNALTLQRLLDSGATLVLRAADGSVRPAPIPVVPGAASAR